MHEIPFIPDAVIDFINPASDYAQTARDVNELTSGGGSIDPVTATAVIIGAGCNATKVCSYLKGFVPDPVANAVRNVLGTNKPKGNGILTTDGSNNALSDIRKSQSSRSRVNKSETVVDPSQRQRKSNNWTKPEKTKRRSAWETAGDIIENVQDILRVIF